MVETGLIEVRHEKTRLVEVGCEKRSWVVETRLLEVRHEETSWMVETRLVDVRCEMSWMLKLDETNLK